MNLPDPAPPDADLTPAHRRARSAARPPRGTAGDPRHWRERTSSHLRFRSNAHSGPRSTRPHLPSTTVLRSAPRQDRRVTATASSTSRLATRVSCPCRSLAEGPRCPHCRFPRSPPWTGHRRRIGFAREASTRRRSKSRFERRIRGGADRLGVRSTATFHSVHYGGLPGSGRVVKCCLGLAPHSLERSSAETPDTIGQLLISCVLELLCNVAQESLELEDPLVQELHLLVMPACPVPSEGQPGRTPSRGRGLAPKGFSTHRIGNPDTHGSASAWSQTYLREARCRMPRRGVLVD